MDAGISGTKTSCPPRTETDIGRGGTRGNGAGGKQHQDLMFTNVVSAAAMALMPWEEGGGRFFFCRLEISLHLRRQGGCLVLGCGFSCADRIVRHCYQSSTLVLWSGFVVYPSYVSPSHTLTLSLCICVRVHTTAKQP